MLLLDEAWVNNVAATLISLQISYSHDIFLRRSASIMKENFAGFRVTASR